MSNRVEVTRSRLAGASAQLRASPSRQYLPPLSPPAQQDAQADSSHQPVGILFGLIVEGFGALVRTDAGVCSGCNEIERILAVLVPGAVQIATLIVSTLLFLVVCKDTVFLRLGVYHAFHAEFWPVLYSFVLAFVCSSGFMVFRIFRAGVDAESYKDEWQDPLYVVAFVLERVSIMVYCSAASVGVFRALSPPLYTKACLLRELRDAEEAGEDGGEALVRGAS
ncbi:unnamed protein product [Pedinophyceae sp. YPF-701]|nr:unnamed protein product [Pedinophyceae sp. YPF-701]